MSNNAFFKNIIYQYHCYVKLEVFSLGKLKKKKPTVFSTRINALAEFFYSFIKSGLLRS